MKTAVLIEKKLSRKGNPQYFFKVIGTDEAKNCADDYTMFFCSLYGLKYTKKELCKVETHEGFKQYVKNNYSDFIQCVIE
jgi:hypothetical protein